MLVLDSSVTLAWIHGDERTSSTAGLFDRVIRDGAIVPALWRFEVANSLVMAVRRKRVTAGFRDRSLEDLAKLPIQIDAESHALAWTATSALAELYRLTVYDAAYLELAQRRRIPLATLDDELRTAGNAAAVELLS